MFEPIAVDELARLEQLQVLVPGAAVVAQKGTHFVVMKVRDCSVFGIANHVDNLFQGIWLVPGRLLSWLLYQFIWLAGTITNDRLNYYCPRLEPSSNDDRPSFPLIPFTWAMNIRVTPKNILILSSYVRLP